MRRDRDGSELPDDDEIDAQDVHDLARCSGWIDRSRAVPCLTCKPWLRQDEPGPAASTDTIAAARQHLSDVLGWPA